MKIKTYGIHDQFTLKEQNKESLTVVENNGITLVIDCPSHTVKSLYNDIELLSLSVITKVDYLIITHTDNDHTSGLANLIWWKLFGEKKRLNLITHENIYNDLCIFLNKIGFGFDRNERELVKKDISSHFNFYPIGYDDKFFIPGFGNIKTFNRATNHQKGMDVLAFQVNDDKNNNVANFSADTSFDMELIDFLFQENGKVIHEIGAYNKKSHSHTDIYELINNVPKNQQNRLYVNHIPESREQEILNTIQDYNSKIRFASQIK